MNKQLLRAHYRKLRASISEERRKEAGIRLKEVILPRAEEAIAVLSFSTLHDEINTEPLNSALVKVKKLVLPKIFTKSLRLFLVSSLSDLQSGAFGILEPNPIKCDEVKIEEIPLLLVPALTADSTGARIGYGGGFYDRLLACRDPTSHSITVLFAELLYPEFLPQGHFDQKVQEVLTI